MGKANCLNRDLQDKGRNAIATNARIISKGHA